MTDWRDISTAPEDAEILIGSWFEDDASGYYGDSRWKWIASGLIENGEVWIDQQDDFVGALSELAGFDKPTHWAFLPARPNTQTEQERP